MGVCMETSARREEADPGRQLIQSAGEERETHGRSPPLTAATTANVVMMPSMPPKTRLNSVEQFNASGRIRWSFQDELAIRMRFARN